VLAGAAEQQGGLAPAAAAAATRIRRLLAAKLEELRSMQPGGLAPTRRPSGGDSSGGQRQRCVKAHRTLKSERAMLRGPLYVLPACRCLAGCLADVTHMHRRRAKRRSLVHLQKHPARRAAPATPRRP
jgi:hypothetical protein